MARKVERALGAEATRPVLAAGLLHDVGKLDAGLGTFGRVLATAVASAVGREAAAGWSRRGGLARRIALYVRHPELGADMLAVAGSHRTTVTWAREHHLPPERCTVARLHADALRAADDD